MAKNEAKDVVEFALDRHYPDKMTPFVPLVRRAQIEKRIGALAQQTTNHYRGRKVHLLGVMKGVTPFLGDLMKGIGQADRRMDINLSTVELKSYSQGTSSSGTVRHVSDLHLPEDAAERELIIADDIADSGLTLSRLVSMVQPRVRSVAIACLVRKPAMLRNRVQVNYVGFDVSDNPWLMGYGMDTAEKGRFLPDLYVPQPDGNQALPRVTMPATMRPKLPPLLK